MVLNEIRVEKLFGHFTHVVPFNKTEKLTIITAPNGYGKTIMLKILHSIFNQKLSFLNNLEFEKISLLLDSNILNFEKSNEQIVISYFDSEGTRLDTYDLKIEIEIDAISNSKLNIIEDIEPRLERLSRREWLDIDTNETLSLEEVLERFEEINAYLDFPSFKYPIWLKNIINAINVHFVQDQRLIQRSNISRDHMFHHQHEDVEDTIEKYANELAQMISTCNNAYSEVSKRLDGSLPYRLLSKTKEIELINIGALKIKLEELIKKNKKLNKYNLLTSDNQFIPSVQDVSDEDIKLLSLYIQDNNEKLEGYDDLVSRIELFTEILNNKGLAFKAVDIVPGKGFVFKTLHGGDELKLTQLSSGEQHEVVLIYELIFIAKDNDLVLIDEPEISLHIAWQKEFLEDIKKIIDIQNVSVVIATHSPQIIDNNWDLTVDLED